MTDNVYASRRRAFLDAMGEGTVAVVAAAPVHIRNNDVEHEYRQDSDFFYLTGLDEPDSVLVLSRVHEEHDAVLFVRPRDPERETWDGPRTGVDGAVTTFGATAAFEFGTLGKKLAGYLSGAHTLHYRFGLHPEMDAQVFRSLDVARRMHRNKKAFPRTFVDPGIHLHEARLRKDASELDTMRAAARVTHDAHLAAMRAAAPARYEYELEAEILGVFRRAGCERPAYGPIVGSGPNATILHHRRNDRQIGEDDLVLIDAGCELGYYACDVTRTFPANGRFTPPQRALYEVVLRAQQACIDATRPGATIDAIHETAVAVITEGLVDLGLVEGPVADAIEHERYRAFYMHRTSHWLGMDVHDVGLYYVDGEARPLEPGMVITIEPGVYVSQDAEVDPKWRGIGIRIEDDILVTEDGNENLTVMIPRSVDEVEAAVQAAQAAE
ncbi:MAG: aminopeptidase P N-terminal domain-containing protein [Sandaracinaceae bacterium]